MGERTGKLYMPSNGTEGMWFTDKFCENCIHEKFMHTQKEGDKKCDIFSRSILHWYDVKNPAYPQEWIYDENDQPTCTAFYKWDWGSNDDEGGLREPPPEPEPPDPNQLCFPFIIDEIEENSLVKKELQTV